MLARLTIFIAGGLGVAMTAAAADPPAVRLIVKPLLCVIDKDETACTITFDVRWKSMLAGRVLPERQRATDAAAVLAARAMPVNTRRSAWSAKISSSGSRHPLAPNASPR